MWFRYLPGLALPVSFSIGFRAGAFLRERNILPKGYDEVPFSAGDQDGIRRLVHDMNTQLEDPLMEGTLSRTFAALWPQLEAQLLKIDNEHPGVRATRRDEREVVEEILTLVRESIRP